MTNDHTKLAGRLTEAQVLAMRVIGMTDAESLTCIPQADGMLVVSAMDDDGKTYALDLQSLFKALAAEPEAPVPNPTDTARALVDRHAMAVRQYWALNSRTPEKKRQAVFAEALDARAALLAHVAGVEQLATFGARVLMQHHGDGERGDVDGGWLQETAVELGVMTTETKTVPCGERCPCGDFVDHGETTECVPISNFALVRQLATRPTEARDA